MTAICFWLVVLLIIAMYVGGLWLPATICVLALLTLGVRSW